MHMNRIRILGLVLIFSVAGFAEQHKTPQGCGRGRSGNRMTWRQQAPFFFPVLALGSPEQPSIYAAEL
jgi:hypothetical protein